MNNNNQNFATDTWGQSIISEFLKDGGFQNLDSKHTAHEKFQNLIEIDYDPDDVWDRRCNALAVWAFICIEQEVPSEQLELLCISIAAAMERLPNGAHPLWLGQLAFDLVLFLKYSDLSSAPDCTNLALELFRTVKQAAKSFHADPMNRDKDFFQEGKIDPEDFGRLLGVPERPDVKHLLNTQKLLLQLGDSGINEALYLLVILDMGDSKHQKSWLEQAAKGAWPSSQLAAFYLGFLLQAAKKVQGDDYLFKVVFPLEEDTDYGLLSDLALKAKYHFYSGGKTIPNLYGYDEEFKKGLRGGYFQLWSRKGTAKNVADQWETVEWRITRVGEEAEKDGSLELPDHIRSLTLETGRLIEVFLKWCLREWPAAQSVVREIKGVTEFSHLLKIIGPILGNKKDGGVIGLDELGIRADLKLNKIPFIHNDLLYGKPWDVWSPLSSLLSLVTANAIAARCNDKHPFCNTPSDSLIKLMSIFKMAYVARNQNAHYAVSIRETSANEAIFLAGLVMEKVDQFMADYALLPR